MFPSQLSEALEAEQSGHADTRRRLDAAKARVSSLQREAAQLREGARTLVDKSDVDDKLVAALRSERLSLQQQLSQVSRAGGDGAGGSPRRTVFTGGQSRAAFSVAGSRRADPDSPGTRAGSASMAGGSVAGGDADADRLAAEGERVSRLAQGQARRLDAQEKLISDLRVQLREAKRAAAAAGAAAGSAAGAGGGSGGSAVGVGSRAAVRAELPPGVPGRTSSGGGGVLTSRGGVPRPESASTGAGAAGPDTSAGRPGSAASVRAVASLEVRLAAAEEAAAAERVAAAALRESRDKSEERCRLLERQADQYVAKFSALERRCRELEARVGAAPPVTDAVSLAAQLATSENERRALRGNTASAIAARDAEVARLREQCDALMARHRQPAGPARAADA